MVQLQARIMGEGGYHFLNFRNNIIYRLVFLTNILTVIYSPYVSRGKHAPSRPFACSVCRRSFKSKSILGTT